MSVPATLRTAGRAPWGLLGTLAVVLAVESWVHHHPLEFRDLGPLSYEWPVWSSREAWRYDLLAFGDSQVKLGVAPAVLQHRLRRPALNLAAPGGIAPLTYYLLRRSLNSGARPSAVVLDFNPVLLGSGLANTETCLARSLGLPELLDLAWQGGDPVLAARLLALHALPSLAFRDTIRDRVVGQLREKDASPAGATYLLLRHWQINRGAWLKDVRPDSAAVAEHHNERLLTEQGRWIPEPLTEAYLRRTLDLAESRGVRVYWVLPPMHPRVEAGRVARGSDGALERVLHEALARYPNLTVLDGRATAIPAGRYIDAVHLDAEGAYHFTVTLADALAASPAAAPRDPAARWVTLPPHRAGPVELPLEDESGSRLALEADHRRAAGVTR